MSNKIYIQSFHLMSYDGKCSNFLNRFIKKVITLFHFNLCNARVSELIFNKTQNFSESLKYTQKPFN